jgi:DNA polymerase-3 subunit delta
MSAPKQALAELEKGQARPLYYLYGEEPFKIDEFIEKARVALFGRDTDVSFCLDKVDGAQATGSEVLEKIQSMGLFGSGGGRRLVIVRQAHLVKEVDPLSAVAMSAGKESPWGDSVLILAAESLDGRRKFHQWLKKQGLAIEFKPARDAELTQWVSYLAKKRGITVDAEAAELLAVVSGGSLYRLEQELEKAWLYSGGEPGAKLTREGVSAVGAAQASHELVDLVRAILEAKRARALLLAEKLVQAPEDALGLVGFLVWALKNPGRGLVGAIAGGQIRVRRLVGRLVELDERLKSSALDAGALIERFIVEETA